MKIAVVCANGKAGTRIVNEAVQRRLDVTAVVRGENCSNTKRVIQKDLFDLTTNDLKEFDVVIDAFGAWTDETLSQHSTSLKHLCDILSNTDIRLLVVGGAGSLYTDFEHTQQLMDGKNFPEMFKPLASNTVSYTHLDVYKRQLDTSAIATAKSTAGSSNLNPPTTLIYASKFEK